jgi:hypothetical protein
MMKRRRLSPLFAFGFMVLLLLMVPREVQRVSAAGEGGKSALGTQEPVTDKIETRRFKLTSKAFDHLMRDPEKEAKDPSSRLTAQVAFTRLGFDLPAGTEVRWDEKTQELVVRHERRVLRELQKIIRRNDGNIPQVEVELRLIRMPLQTFTEIFRPTSEFSDPIYPEPKALASLDELVKKQQAVESVRLKTIFMSGEHGVCRSEQEISYISDYRRQDGAWKPVLSKRKVSSQLEGTTMISFDWQTISMTLSFKHTGLRTEVKKAKILGKDAGEQAFIEAPDFVTMESETSFSLFDGQTVVLLGYRLNSSADEKQEIFVGLVTANIH